MLVCKGEKMKKLSVLLSMAIVCGVALAAFEQPIPLMGNEPGENYFAQQARDKAIAAQKKTEQFINKIQEEGKKVDIDYTFIVSPAQKTSDGSSWEIKRTCEVQNVWELNNADDGNVYFLLNRSGWDKMYTDCMPKETNRVLYNKAGHRSQQIIETWRGGYLRTRYIHTSPKGKIALLNHKHYKVKGQEYTVITLKKSK